MQSWIDSGVRTRASNLVEKSLRPAPPLTGRLALLPFNIGVTAVATTVVVSRLIVGPHLVRRLLYASNVAYNGTFSANLLWSNNNVATLAAALGDDSLTGIGAAATALLPTNSIQTLVLDRVVNTVRSFYKCVFTVNSGTIVFSFTLDIVPVCGNPA